MERDNLPRSCCVTDAEERNKKKELGETQAFLEWQKGGKKCKSPIAKPSEECPSMARKAQFRWIEQQDLF